MTDPMPGFVQMLNKPMWRNGKNVVDNVLNKDWVDQTPKIKLYCEKVDMAITEGPQNTHIEMTVYRNIW